MAEKEHIKGLNLGCGDDLKKEEGWVNIDIRPVGDLVCDVRKLPYLDDSVEKIAAMDVLEHLGRHDTVLALKEWYRVLEDGGVLELKVPNLLVIINRFLAQEITDYEFVRVLYGEQDYPENTHKAGFTPDTLSRVLSSTGFLGIKVVKGKEGDINNMWVTAKK